MNINDLIKKIESKKRMTPLNEGNEYNDGLREALYLIDKHRTELEADMKGTLRFGIGPFGVEGEYSGRLFGPDEEIPWATTFEYDSKEEAIKSIKNLIDWCGMIPEYVENY